MFYTNSIFFFLSFLALVSTQGTSSEFTIDFDFAGVAPTCCPISPPPCGDGICNASVGEGCSGSRFPCWMDCNCGPLCGDGVCTYPENCTTCPGECGACPVCGDHICEPTETCQTCDTDCGQCLVCGDGLCVLSEDCNTCPQDCGMCPAGQVQGQIVDAMTHVSIPNATVQLYVNGIPQATLTTDSTGWFLYLAVPIPYALFKITAEGYYDAWTQVQVIQGQQNTFVRGMSPYLAEIGQWRVVLTWGSDPTDMDLTLFGPYDTEIYDNGVCDWEYTIKNESLPWAGYTSDSLHGSGPEAITVTYTNSSEDPLEFWVHNYSGDRDNPSELMRNSTACVWVFSYFGQLGEWIVPLDAPINALWWHVFNIRAGMYVDNINQYFPGEAADCEYDYCPWIPA